ncbi:suppressor APC domain-containing protein 2-like [Discoglossus pictus]
MSYSVSLVQDTRHCVPLKNIPTVLYTNLVQVLEVCESFIKGVSRSQSINSEFSSTPRHLRQDRARRHTLTNGIDYNTLRRMKELEHERDTLLDRVQLVERAQEWYKERLHQAEQQRELQFCKDPPLVPPPPILGSTLLIQIQEVNRFLGNLISSSEKVGHRKASCPTRHPENLSTLKHQNQLLTRELSAQNERIWKLQRENEALYRELHKQHIHRATFI